MNLSSRPDSPEHQKNHRKEGAFLPENQITYSQPMENQNVSWPCRFQPSALLWGTLHTLALTLCLHLFWSTTVWTVHDHVNHSIPAILQMQPPFDLGPTSLQVATDMVAGCFMAGLAGCFRWLRWLGLALLLGWGLGSLVYHLFTAAY